MGFLKYLLLIVSSLLASVSYDHITEIKKNSTSSVDEVLYLPNGLGLEFLSFGYRNTLAHTLWFNTISYFGKHYKKDRDYKWLNHMCNLVTDLNPRMPHVYDFCSLMLAWEANFPEDSIKILDKAITTYPQDWNFPYLRGMAYLIFLKNPEKAQEDFVRSSRQEGSHPVVKRLAAHNISLTDRKETAIEFLEEMIKNSKQESERSALKRKLEEIRAEN